MKILILGLPGSGKSTQVDKLATYLKVPTLKMGSILRDIAHQKSELGKKIGRVMLQGHLVDDKIVEEIISQKVQELKTSGFVMEGYPRTVHQITGFDPGFEKVFYLKIDTKVAHERMYARAREDDNKVAIENRFNEQMKDLDKILKHYEDILTVLDATKGIDEIFDKLIENLPKNKN
jgi:adenylate kinase family enzyme